MKQVLADLALSPIANRYVEDLTQSEYRRLTIGVSNYLIRNNTVNFRFKEVFGNSKKLP